MERHYWTYLMMAAALMAAACTGVEDEVGAEQQTAEPQMVDFGAYLQRGITRAGTAGTLTTNGGGSGEVSLKTAGFGVIGYYTDEARFNEQSKPNFMYNQQVTHNGTSWTYEPMKYWPNEALDNRLTFFAYAPYVEVTPATGFVTGDAATGISMLSTVSMTGEPYVRYYVSLTPSECVDLCWANPQKDLQKSSVSEKVGFNFRHALASLNVRIKTDVDDSEALDSKTRIWVRQVTFEGFDMSGQLNLGCANTPVWHDALGGGRLGLQPVNIYDGRKDGKEGVLASTTEQTLGLNPQLVQDAPYLTAPTFSTITTGVTAVAMNLFNEEQSATAPVMVIPTGAPLKVTIVYDIETYDPLLTSNYLSDGHANGRTIENTIAAVVTTDGTTPIVMEAGKRYTIDLMLGLNSVKTSASIGGWGSNSSGNGDVPDDTGDDTGEETVGTSDDYGDLDDDEWQD